MTGMLEKVRGAIPSGYAMRLLTDLVSMPSCNPPGDEAEVAKYVADAMSLVGCEVEMQEVKPGRPNVIARLKGNGGGKTVILNTHMDVVPPGSGWTSDPYTLRRDGDNLVGRGAMDAKGSLAAMMAAIAAIAASGIERSGDIVLAAVVDEEMASLGARHLPDTLTADAAMIGEATNGNLAIAHRGSMRPVMIAEGVAAHSSTPQLGVNAVHLMAQAIVSLEQYAQHTLSQRAHPLAGAPTLSVTIVRGGTKESMIPDACEAVIDRRLIPGEDEAEALREIERVVSTVPGAASRIRIKELVPTTGGASEIAPDHPIVALASRSVGQVYGKDPECVGLTANCDMSHFIHRGIPAVIYGPGDFRYAHTVDERVSVSELENATWVYALFALEAAGVTQKGRTN